jgi:hypothetical protein
MRFQERIVWEYIYEVPSKKTVRKNCSRRITSSRRKIRVIVFKVKLIGPKFNFSDPCPMFSFYFSLFFVRSISFFLFLGIFFFFLTILYKKKEIINYCIGHKIFVTKFFIFYICYYWFLLLKKLLLCFH